MIDPDMVLIIDGQLKATSRGLLNIWTVYDHPKDFPNSFVARRFEMDKITDDVIEAATLDALREKFANCGLVCLTRHPNDDPCILETWL